jgi:di- and tripeptidase/Cys-Gly metallodipeptidase DUG1
MLLHLLQVSGPQRDLHSGNDGGVFSEPMADLVQLLGALHGPGGKISVPGFNNHVRPQLMDLAWQGLQHSEEFSMQSYRCGLRNLMKRVLLSDVWLGGCRC